MFLSLETISQINTISLFIVVCVLFPLLIGLFQGLTANGILSSILSLIMTLEKVIYAISSFILTKNIFFKEETKAYQWINPWLPKKLKEIVLEQDMMAYLVFTPILFLLFLILNSLLIRPLYNQFFTKISGNLQSSIRRIPSFFRHIFGFIWNTPKAAVIAVLLGLGLNLFSYFTPDTRFNMALNSSVVYKNIYDYALKPLLHSNVAKDIPLILNNTFTFEEQTPKVPAGLGQVERKFPPGVRVINYFNGVTLDQAVKSDNKIDLFARELTKAKSLSKEKAKIIYQWISKNIAYDEEKAKNISKNSKDYNSGAVEAFYTRKGICFDYASLFVAMCRASQVKVSLATGVAYNGITWGDHAWNKAFSSEENKWINVDTTFGTVDNYFDKKDFYADHRYEKVREEW